MSLREILVWDVSTRVFHWLLTFSFAGAFLTSDSERQRDLHILFGVTMLVLIAFRLVRGIVGTLDSPASPSAAGRCCAISAASPH